MNTITEIKDAIEWLETEVAKLKGPLGAAYARLHKIDREPSLQEFQTKLSELKRSLAIM